MKKAFQKLLRATCFAAVMGWGGIAFGVDLYVATTGDDEQAGTAEQPLATLQAARDRLRVFKSAGDAGPHRVIVGGGEYYLSEPLELTADDSGSPDAPITYQAAAGETVRLIGGQAITTFARLEDEAIRERLPETARDEVFVADLISAGITDFGELQPRGAFREMQPAALELFVGGQAMPVASWPNKGFTKTQATGNPGRVSLVGETPRTWFEPTNAWVHGFLENDWSDSLTKLDSLDPRSKTLRLAPPLDKTSVAAGARFRVLNVLEELDQPGEWFLDRDSGQLYFWPPADVETATPIVSLLETPVSLYDVEHVTLHGFTIEAARVMGVEIAGGSDVTVSHCTIRNIGNIGVHLYDGENHSVEHCEITGTGDGGIRVDGGDRETLTAGGHRIENNHIHQFSRTCWAYRPAVNVFGVGNRVANNLIHDGPHCAILLQGNDHVVELNEIHSVCQETDDVGAIYLGGDVTARGNVIRHNLLRDLGGFSTIGVMAIYLDDFASGTTVYGNVCRGVGRGVAVGGGRDNTIENNLFVDCVAGIQIDNRGQTWAKHFVEGDDCQVRQQCAEVQHDKGVYADRYPSLANLLNDEPGVAKGNVVTRNVVCCRIGIDLHDGLNHNVVAVKDNFVDADPQFMDPDHRDLRLRDSSPAVQIGFQEIPWQKIGRQTTEFTQPVSTGD